ncbi:hypothetical protein COU16_01210 [Candidatus Kaiserbacteria bacterium CG10_big_fil_rev_8_21_14_0_10_47_16]|uniref:Uncharacterized protein n=1 Tax=Candidatus Kaiserbacteria bacterium CG10_big_fil_rev_8_21_14_0_10_47_16 TaxID=1974608 RepID=A0A2H0UED1_9BACT|nr:MAG: hypothetical protein COU16_01210 [Candidatus Kaiserbacteria bacterium CG10_big_fil_rev_8_21_14_0_10_47_16]
MSGASNFGQDHGLIHEAVITGRKAGWTSSEWAKLAHDEGLMLRIREVMHSRARIECNNNIIELSSMPKDIPDKLMLFKHQVIPREWVWDECEVELKLVPGQSPGVLTGQDIDSIIQSLGWNCLNSAVQQFLLENQAFIPGAWRNCKIFFWGSIFTDGFRGWVPYMEWQGDIWRGSFRKLSERWIAQEPAAVFTR